jgi:hypothetical protein
MSPLGFIIALLIGLAVIAGYAAILAVLIMAFIAAPSFWVTFWLVLAVLFGLVAANKA